jgi:hypothetical protein
MAPVLLTVWPHSLYGVTKVFGQALGRYLAYVRPMSVICLRIGGMLYRRHNELALRLWLSPDDVRRLIDRRLNAVVRFGVYYGVSAMARSLCTDSSISSKSRPARSQNPRSNNTPLASPSGDPHMFEPVACLAAIRNAPTPTRPP